MKREGKGRAGSSPRTNGRVRRRRRAELSVPTITAAAVRLADAEGLDAVSIRRLAAALDARPMSLYDHIADKRELLSLMAERTLGEGLSREPLSGDWRTDLGALSRRLLAVLLAHPWLAFAFAAGTRVDHGGIPQAAQFAVPLTGSGMEPDEARLVAATLSDYVLGHALRIGTAEAAPDAPPARAAPERFEAGLRIVLDGIEARLGA